MSEFERLEALCRERAEIIEGSADVAAAGLLAKIKELKF